MTAELLQGVQTPQPFIVRKEGAQTRELVENEGMALGDYEGLKLAGISELLSMPEFDALIDQGQITLGIVKPRANEGKDLPVDDEEATQFVLDEIGRENIIFTFSTKLKPEEADAFYSDLKEKYSTLFNAGLTKSVWDSISEFTRSGPLTFVLIHRPQGDAVSWWRERMGATRASQADPGSIRGRHAIEENLPNNITHGSDSIDSVRKEVGVLRGIVLKAWANNEKNRSLFPSNKFLHEAGFLSDGEEMVSIKRVVDSDGYEVQIRNSQGNLTHKLFDREVAPVDVIR